MSHDEGLVFAYFLDGNGGGQAIDWGKLKRWSPERGALWLHLDYESKKVQKRLAEESGLSPILCEALFAVDVCSAHGLFVPALLEQAQREIREKLSASIKAIACLALH